MNPRWTSELVHDQELKPSAKIVGVHMLLCPDAQTATEIAKAVGLHRATVSEALLVLREQEWVSRRHHLWIGEVA
ncbi:helix-turn-helix domain-containing protein [Streptomyces sp. NBC_00343]|uniref:helix-turn-helix domain-containing protein n=1 Tax=Streptomyces sp. NBC_00343 TaxID=2975719 RepID=UPI002E2A0BB0|nr:helix-turn-helix domain-containing protein [Streptomyces sp. NBC_00343]